MRWIPLLIVAALVGTASTASASRCVNLTVSAHTKRALKRAHGHRDGKLERGSIFYGRCGSTRYAIGVFTKALADQPEKFRRKAGHAWKDKGDGFENGCDAGARRPIPTALVRLWGVCPQL